MVLSLSEDPNSVSLRPARTLVLSCALAQAVLVLSGAVPATKAFCVCSYMQLTFRAEHSNMLKSQCVKFSATGNLYLRSPHAGYEQVAIAFAVNRAAYLTISTVFPDTGDALRTSGAARAGTTEAATAAADAPEAFNSAAAGKTANDSFGSPSGFERAAKVGITWGERVAGEIRKDRKSDGSKKCVFKKMFTDVPVVPAPGHLPDPTFPKDKGPQKMYAPFWGEVKPFGFKKKFTDKTITPLPPPLSLDYAEDYEYVRLIGRQGIPRDRTCPRQSGPAPTRTPQETETVRLASPGMTMRAAVVSDRAHVPKSCLLQQPRSVRSVAFT
jgi:hypothetical protein